MGAVLIAGPYPQVSERLKDRRLFEAAQAGQLSEAERAEVRVIVVSGVQPLNAEAMDRYPNLGRIVALGAGYDGVDAAAARARGIEIVSGAGANADDVADMAVGLLIACARGLFPNDARVRAGGWVRGQWEMVRSISALKVGIVGLGHIGKAVAARLAPFRCEVAWNGPRAKPDVSLPYEPDILALARRSDALVLAAPLNADTAGVVDARVIEALGPQGILVNVGRGGLVDEDALIAALKDGRLGGAGLDVFVEEPTPPARWEGVPNVILQPHTAAVTHEALDNVYAVAARNVTDFLDRAKA